MTLTKYQRGDLMDGWNDCPQTMVRSLHSSSTSVDKDGRSNSLTETGSLDETPDFQNVIEELLQHPNTVPEKLLKQIKDKLNVNIDKMTPAHKGFVYEISQDVKLGTDIPTIKNKIIEFMMVNDRVSGWCVPLKKFVENIDRTK